MEGKSKARRVAEGLGVTAAILGGGYLAADHFSSKKQHEALVLRQAKERVDAQQKIADVYKKIEGIDAHINFDAKPGGVEADKDKVGDVVAQRDAKLRDFFEKKYPQYELSLAEIKDGVSKYEITFEFGGEEETLVGFRVEEDGGFTMQVPAFIDKQGRLGTQTRNFDADDDIFSTLDRSMKILDYIRERGPATEGQVDTKIADMSKNLGFELKEIESIDDLDED